MPPERVERKLAAILAADVAGYSRLIGVDEEGTLRRLKAHRNELIDPKITEHQGRVVKVTGDGILIEFASAVAAMRCAVEVQRGIAERNESETKDRQIEFRVGLHQGDIIVEDGDILGDGVNIAARLEALAEPGGICVSQRIHEDVVGKVDAIFEDMGEQQLKNIARPVRVFRIRAPDTEQSPPSPKPALALPDKPSIAVLPFTNLSGDPEQDYFADGMVEEIITALSRFRQLFVIARNSSFAYKGKSPDIRQVGRELGVRYVLEGSVRKAANRVRITGQLVDTSTGIHLWADRFDGRLEDIFDLQDQVTTSVVGAIGPKLERAEIERAKQKRAESLDAYDYYLQALPHFYAISHNSNERALQLLYRAIERGPTFAPAFALASQCFLQRRSTGWTGSDAGDVAEGVRLAEAALALDSEDPFVLWAAGHAFTTLGRDHKRGRGLIDRSLMLNPNSSQAWCISGWSHAFLGAGQAGVEDFEHALRLSPLDPIAYYVYCGMACAKMVLEDYEAATDWAERALQERPNHASSLRILAASLGQLGRTTEARNVIRRLLEVDIGLTVSAVREGRTNIASPAALNRYLDGLRKAGLPE